MAGTAASLESGMQSGARACAKVLRQHRGEVVTRLIAGHQHPRPNRFDDPAELFRKRVGEGLDLLAGHLEGQPDFGTLYMGQRNFELFHLEKTREENQRSCRQGIEEDAAVLRSFLAGHVDAGALAVFELAYQDATQGLLKEAARHVRTLFVGDCLLSEILSFLVGPLMNDGLSIEPFPVNARDPAQLRRVLGELATQTFDVVFFSPFSHARLPELEALMDPRRALMPSREIDALVSAVIDQTRALLDVLANRFECPIFVHNAGFVPRGRGAVQTTARLALSHRARRQAGQRINQWLADYVALHNKGGFQHLFVLDERALVDQDGRMALGRYLHTSEFQHATVFSQRLAREYHPRIWAVGHLVGKKLVVCDLDNTLWDGVIGEGAVAHFADRQHHLKRLKDHGGVVLSIASKNEPANVHFKGGVLTMEDFVAPQISWGQKSAAVGKIKQALNLQTRHMVFLDDRGDERALMGEAFPDLLALDPCDPATWERMGLWSQMVHGSSDLDRTAMYQEQALRDAALGAPQAEQDGAAGAETLSKLGLVISIARAQKGDLKRVTELINRTNQWNLCGSRTTFEQVRGWHESDKAHVLLASASDRFGDMGVVCVAVVTEEQEQAAIAVFVLSCRVFGYGVESAMLGEIGKVCGIGSRHKALMGHFKANAQNHPCRNMYTDHGFEAGAHGFSWSGTPALPTVPWAQVRSLV